MFWQLSGYQCAKNTNKEECETGSISSSPNSKFYTCWSGNCYLAEPHVLSPDLLLLNPALTQGVTSSSDAHDVHQVNKVFNLFFYYLYSFVSHWKEKEGQWLKRDLHSREAYKDVSHFCLFLMKTILLQGEKDS